MISMEDGKSYFFVDPANPAACWDSKDAGMQWTLAGVTCPWTNTAEKIPVKIKGGSMQ
jgi:hypothetical protein